MQKVQRADNDRVGMQKVKHKLAGDTMRFANATENTKKRSLECAEGGQVGPPICTEYSHPGGDTT